uniref:Uncharacterized protein n=1 Tax=Anguilla anguilla TaxID=7936 RepID=A0A0E9R8D3_ANGAN
MLNHHNGHLERETMTFKRTKG